MNKQCFKTVFSKRLGAIVVVSEITGNSGKACGGFTGHSFFASWSQFVGKLSCACALVLAAYVSPLYAAPFAGEAAPAKALSLSATALPTGGRVVQGAASISQNGAAMNINQTTSKAVVNWQSFDIGSSAKVTVDQPNTQSVLLSRVVSDNPSQILGQLSANGQIVLVNPNGVTFGRDGSVSTAGLTASTLGISDADFMAGKMNFNRNGSTAALINQGSLKAAPGGYVALLGSTVSNEGTITVPQGTAYLAAAESVKLPLSGTGKIKLELLPSTVNAMVANQAQGVIVAEGGQVFMQASAVPMMVASVLQSGSVDTSGEQAGAVKLLADGGEIKVDGRITANSSGQDDQGQLRKGGDILIGRDEETGVLAKFTNVSGARLESNKGFVETSGEHLTSTGISVAAGSWLLDPVNLEINATNTAVTAGNSVVLSGDISTALTNGTDVMITTGTGTSSTSTASGVNQSTTGSTQSTGYINVNDNITKVGGGTATLTLMANTDIVVAAGKKISSTSGALNVLMNSNLGSAGGGIIFNAASGISSNGGNITLGGGSSGTASAAAVGTAASSNRGIYISASVIDAGGGNVSLIGQGSSSGSIGVDLDSALINGSLTGSSVKTTGSGTITVTGTGGTGIASNNYGVHLQYGSSISSTTGTNTVTGTGGASTGSGNSGIHLNQNSNIKTTVGNLTINATGGGAGGASNNNYGIFSEGSQMNTSSGTVTVTATAGVGNSDGLQLNQWSGLSSAGSVFTSNGTVNVTGTGSGTGYGINLMTQYGQIKNNGNGAINITTDSINIDAANNALINAGTGTVTIQNKTTGTLLGVGGTDVLSGSQLTLGITSAELNRITAATTKVGSSTAGNLTVSGAITTASTTGNLYLQTNGTATVNADVSSGAGLFIQTTGDTITNKAALSGSNISLDNTNGVINTVTGAINKGSGKAAAATTVSAINLLGAITSTGNVNIAGVSNATANSIHGVNIGAGVSSTGGTITINGETTASGGGAAGGVYVNGQTINAGTTNDITITGTATNGYGLFTIGNTTLTGKNITLTGTANVTTSGTGVFLRRDGTTNITANNNLSILGTITGSGTGQGVITTGSQTSSAMLLNATNGTINIKGVQQGNTNNTSNTLYLAGFRANAKGDISLQAEAASSKSMAIQMNREAGSLNNYDDGWRMQVRSTSGNVLIQSNQGAVLGQDINGGVNITGKNIVLDNTGAGMTVAGVANANGGSIDTTTGAIVLGSGTSSYATSIGNSWSNGSWVPLGVSLASGTVTGTGTFQGSSTGNITATGFLTIGGSSSATQGAIVGSTITVPGNINIVGRSSKVSTIGVSVAASLNSSANIALTGESTNATKGLGLAIGAEVKTTGTSSTTTLISTTSSVSGSGNITTAAGNTGAVTVNTFENGTLSGVISGGTALTKLGAGMTTLTGTNTNSGQTTITAGALQIGDGNTTGNLGSGAILDNAILIFNRSNSITQASIISGSGTLQQIGSGTTTLTGDNIYTGQTTISGGTLQIGSGGSTGTLGTSGAVALSNNANLSYVRSASTTIANGISGMGNVSASITGSTSTLTASDSINLTGGTVNLAADNGITVSAPIATSNTTSSAVLINAGKSTATGVSTGGDLIFNGAGTVSVGPGGRATLMAGSVAGSTGLTALVGSGSGNFRYNSDESTTNYTTSLSSGLYAIYRQAPTIYSTVNNVVKAYDGQTYSGGNGIGAFSGLLNGDTNAQLGTINYGGTSQSAKNASASTYSLSGTVASGLGYGVSLTPGNLVINKAALALSGTKVYDQSKAFAGSNLTATGVHGETFSVTGVGDTSNLASKNVQTNQALNSVTGLTLGASANGGLSTNYEALSTAGSSVSVTPKAASFSAIETNTTYSGSAQTQASTKTGFITGDALTFAGEASGTNANTYGSSLSVTGADATNYNVTLSNANLVINKAALALSGTKVYDQSKAFAGSNLTATGVHGETFSVTGVGDTSNLATKNVQTNQALSTITGLSLGTSSNGGLSTNYEALSTVGSSVSVTPKAATITGTATTLTYNGAVQTQSPAVFGGVYGGDVVTATGLASGNNANSYTSALSVTGADAGNYNFAVTNANLVINKAALTVTAGAVTKVYDGKFIADGSGAVGALAGAAAGDVVNNGGQQSFLNKDAGTGKSVRASGVTIKDASNVDKTANYQITYVDNTTSVISKAPLTVTARDDARFVTQADAASFNGADPIGFVNGETSGVLSGSLTISRINAATNVAAGTYKNVLVPTGLTSNNYEISFVKGTYTIVPANQLLIKTENVSTVYGTTPNYNTTAQYLLDDGSNPSQIVNLTRTGTSNDYTFTDGVGGSVRTSLKAYSGSVLAPTSLSLNTIVGSYSVKDTSPVVSGGNFLGAPVFVGTLTVNTKSVTPTTSAPSKVYDGTTSMAGATLGMSGKVTADDLSIQGTGAFAQKNVGTNLGYTISDMALSGADSGNYHLGVGVTSFSGRDGVITAAPLVITTKNVTKTYDRLNTASGSAVVTSGTQLLTTDSITGGTFSFTDVNVGTGNKTVSVGGVTVNDGNGGANYSVTYQDNTTSTITPKALNASFTAANKVYNGGLEAIVSAGSADIIAGDVVSISNTSASFDTKHVGVGKTVSVAGVSIGGSASGNYALQNTTATTSANITSKALTASFTGSNKVYEGTVDATVSGISIDKISGDTLTYSSASAAFTNKNVGTGKPIEVNGISLGGADAGNYVLQNTTAWAIGDITPKSLTITATGAVKTYNGAHDAPGTAAVGALATGDVVGNAGSQAFLDANAGSGKVVRASGVAIKDATNADMTGNYQITYQDSNTGVINKAALKATLVGSVSKEYDGNTVASNLTGANYSVTGWFIAGEGATVNQAAGAYVNSNVSNNSGTGAITAALAAGDFTVTGATNLNNYILPTSASGSVGTITAAPLTIKVGNTMAFVTQSPNSAVDNGFTYTGFKNGETAAAVLGPLTRSYVGATNPASGNYSGVYGLAAVPTAANYAVTVQRGDLTVVPADKLLINVGSSETTYGALTASNAGSSATNVKAQYCLVATDCNGVNISNLNMSNNGARWTAVDSSGSTIAFNVVAKAIGKLSTGGFVNVGNYAYATDGLSTTGIANFNGVVVNTGVLTVSPKTLSLSSDGVTKVYDGQTTLPGMALTPAGGMTGDLISATSAGGNFYSKNVGSQSFTVTGLSLYGPDKLNYTFGATSLTGNDGNITPAHLSLTTTNITKTYDGTLSAAGTALVTGATHLFGSDTISGGSFAYNNKNVGNGNKVVSTSAVTVNDGNNGGNYTVSYVNNTTSTITPAALTITAGPTQKTYDGTLNASGSGVVGTLAGAGDIVASAGTMSFTDKNAGTGKTVTVSGAQIKDGSGADITGNYAITYASSSNGVITRAPATISETNQTVIYNGATQTQGAATFSGFVAGDTLQATGMASGRNVGLYTSSLGATGADVGNYDITFVNAPLSITPRAASLGTASQSLVYNGATQTLSGTQGSGFIAGDALTFTGLPSGRNVGQYTASLGVTGADAGNYTITYGNGVLNITPRSASIAAPVTSLAYNGQTQTQNAAILNGVVAGDNIQVTGLANGRNAGTYVSNLGTTGSDLGNYNITYTNNPLTITKAPISFVNTQVADKVYDGETTATVKPGTVTGLVNGESLTVTNVSGQFDTAATGQGKAVTVVYGLADGAGGGLISNYAWSPVQTTANILSKTSTTPLQIVSPLKSSGYSRISYLGFTGKSGAALGTTGEANDSQCSAANLQDCLCEQPEDPSNNSSLEICVVPSKKNARAESIEWHNNLFTTRP